MATQPTIRGTPEHIKSSPYTPRSQSAPTPVTAWIKGLPFPVLLHRQVFTNKDDSIGMLYLACSELDQHGDALETIYQKRWKVEVFHKTLKSHAALAKSPTKRARTQSNHVFMAIYAAFSLEWLRIK